MLQEVGLGGLRVTCSPQDPRFAGSTWRSGCKNPVHKPSGRALNGGLESEISDSLKNLKPEKIGL